MEPDFIGSSRPCGSRVFRWGGCATKAETALEIPDRNARTTVHHRCSQPPTISTDRNGTVAEVLFVTILLARCIPDTEAAARIGKNQRSVFAERGEVRISGSDLRNFFSRAKVYESGILRAAYNCKVLPRKGRNLRDVVGTVRHIADLSPIFRIPFNQVLGVAAYNERAVARKLRLLSACEGGDQLPGRNVEY